MSFPSFVASASPALPFSLQAASSDAAAEVPLASLLRGMVSAGLSLEAICLYLGLTRTALDHALVHLELPTPHDRPLRAPGTRGWSALDTMRLIAWRMDAVHPADIGARLGRSVGGVRARCRRIGVPTPARAALRRHEPSSLAEPSSSVFSRGLEIVGGGQLCWTGHPSDGRLHDHDGAPRPAHSSATSLPSVAEETTIHAASAPPAASTGVSRAVSFPPFPRPASNSAPEPFRSGGDLAWVQEHRRWRRCREVIEALAAAYFGGQHHQKIAERAGVSVAKLQSFWHRVELPRDRHRTRFSEAENDALGRRRLAESGYRLTECAVTGNLFFRHARDVGVRMCRKVRFAQGKLGDWDRYQSQEVSLA